MLSCATIAYSESRCCIVAFVALYDCTRKCIDICASVRRGRYLKTRQVGSGPLTTFRQDPLSVRAVTELHQTGSGRAQTRSNQDTAKFEITH